MSTTSRLAFVLATVVVPMCTPATAQQRNDAGLGAVKRAFDASAKTNPGNVRIVGAAYIKGTTYAASDATGQTARTYVFDKTGKLTTTFVTPVSAGTHDLANDGTSILAASSTGIWVYDTTGKLFNKVVTNNGSKTITNPIKGAALTTLGGFQGLAFNPGGNNGNGSFFVSNAAANILEIDLTGAILNTFGFTPNPWVASGLARDPRTGNIWCLNAANTTDIIELDITKKLTPTGVSFPERWSNQTFRGGLDGIPGGDAGSYKSDFDLVVLNRLNGDDWLVYHRIHLYPRVLGTREAFLEMSINSTTMGTGTLGDLGKIADNDALRWRVNPGKSGSNGLPQFTLVSLGPDASKDAVTAFIPEFTILSTFSSPSSPIFLMLPGVVGTGITGPVTVPPGILRCFELVRFQAVYLDTNAPGPFKLLATNEVWANTFKASTCNIIVEAVGPNSLNTITTSGFFRVIQTGGLPITDITFDFGQTRNPAQFNIYFDTNNPNVANFFDAGNSNVTGCKGTYRNGSDVATGLVYDNQNTKPLNVCAAAANTGWIGSDPYINNAGGFRALKFRFTKFVGGTKATPKVFEFDCDTDGGIGVDGASMAGLVVEITLAGVIKVRGELRVDPSKSQRSVAGF